MTLAIPLRDAANDAGAGGKAANLARLIALGMPVPDGVVLPSAALTAFIDHNGLAERLTRLTRDVDPSDPTRLQRTADAVRTLVMTGTLPDGIEREIATIAASLGSAAVAVRSSAIGEDGAQASFAGQFDTQLGVSGPAELRHAVRVCWASSWSARALFYRTARRVAFAGMGVIVQRQVNAAVSGVLFTRAPEGIPDAGPHDIVIESCEGLGEALVSGCIDPRRQIVPRDSVSHRTDAHLRQLVELALELEAHFEAPQDIEWSVDADGVLWILQARPITTLPSAGSERRRPIALWSNANVSENFPRPISPLLYSIAEAGYYHYFRNLGVAFGVSRRRLQAMDRRLRGIIGVHGARMYYNLTNIHAVLRMAPFGAPLAAAFNQFVGVTETANQPADASAWRDARSRAHQAMELVRIAGHALWQFAFLSRRVRAFERQADAFAARTPRERLGERTLPHLAADLHEFLEIRCHRWKNASLADAASMIGYALLHHAIASEGDAVHTRLLRGLPDIPSSVPPMRLWELSRTIRSDAALEALFERDGREILTALQTDPQFSAFRGLFQRFLDEWGFRSSAELMLAEPSLREDPLPVIELLKGYAGADGESPAATIARQSAERRAETRRLLRGLLRRAPWRIPWTALLIRWTQRAVSYRERVRLKQALLYNRCRLITLAIGTRLVAQSAIGHRDDVFMLTMGELTDLLDGRTMFPYRVRDLIAFRKAQHDQLASMQPPDTIRLAEGEYLRPERGAARAPDATADATEATTLVGTSACGGSITAPAAVLADVRDAERLRRGDVLVTRQTDPGWAPVFCLISGLVIERGGMLSHGAIIAREFGLPCVVGVRDATRRIEHGAMVTVDGDRGICSITAPVAV